MRLWKAFLIFYTRRYRIFLVGMAAVFVLLNTLVPAVAGTNPQLIGSALFLCFMSMIILYGDMEVLAGIYSREGGQIASCQSSFYGEQTMAAGILADRIVSWLWILFIGVVQYLWGESLGTQSIWSMLTGCALIYSVVTIGVNINRFLLTLQGMMICSMLEGWVATAFSIVFFLFAPTGAWWTALLSGILAVALTIGTVCIASHFVKRSYCDV